MAVESPNSHHSLSYFCKLSTTTAINLLLCTSLYKKTWCRRVNFVLQTCGVVFETGNARGLESVGKLFAQEIEACRDWYTDTHRVLHYSCAIVRLIPAII